MTNSSSLGRQVFSSQGSNGPYMRKLMTQLFPGIVLHYFPVLLMNSVFGGAISPDPHP